MEEQHDETVERHLAALPLTPAPQDLRTAVLSGVRRQLKSQRWERTLARAAVALIVVGVGLNAALLAPGSGTRKDRGDGQLKIETITQAAVVIARSSDPQTATQFARRLALLNGVRLSHDDEAGIELRINEQVSNGVPKRRG